MKVYHGRWNDSSKEFIAECETVKDVYEVINKYTPNNPYIRFTDDTEKHKQVIIDYGSWSDFIFIKGVNDIGVFINEKTN